MGALTALWSFLISVLDLTWDTAWSIAATSIRVWFTTAVAVAGIILTVAADPIAMTILAVTGRATITTREHP